MYYSLYTKYLNERKNKFQPKPRPPKPQRIASLIKYITKSY